MNKRNSSGFTLVEIMVAMAIIAVLAAIAFVAFWGLENQQEIQ